ncbi:MAG TPA: DUF1232 domain-containing protein [Anaerolineales bacterium]|nr:DUF1232 domain-containing protein [Anaerolineales bacterium]
MANKRDILTNQNSGFFQDLILKIKLILRLMGDKRVNIFLKILPLAGLIYLISPIDIVPDIVLPVVGYLDDALVIWLCMTLFVALCPDEVVQEHLNALHKVVPGAWREARGEDAPGEVIDVETRHVPPEEK